MEIVGMRALWQIHRVAASNLPFANTSPGIGSDY
jgi:hypothetical protein